MFSANGSQVSSAATYIEDVFSTYLYSGNYSTQSIVNGVDLAGKGGLVWIKQRSGSASSHVLVDTVRGASKLLYSNETTAQFDASIYDVSAFNANGFSLNNTWTDAKSTNSSGQTYASWTFRKQPKFFDVVTYTGTGSARTIAHSLGSTPGCIIVKRTDISGDDWMVYHRGMPSAAYGLKLNDTAAQWSYNGYWNSTAPTSMVFTVGDYQATNASGGTYVAYIFAHDAGGFGLTGTDNVISCGSFTGLATVNLGWEPQWILYKTSGSANSGWLMVDNMRGFTSGDADPYLEANSSAAEQGGNDLLTITSTGFKNNLFSGDTFIYIAIRRGPMKVPTDGTKVFSPVAYTGDNSSNRVIGSLPAGDSALVFTRNYNDYGYPQTWWNRLTGGYALRPYNTNSEVNQSTTLGWDNQIGQLISVGSTNINYGGSPAGNFILYNFKRAPSFFDEVCYTGTGSARTVTHNLGVTPELMIVKSRSSGWNWGVYSAALGPTKYLMINSTAAADIASTPWNNTAPTSSVFTVNTWNATNQYADTYVAYLFATCAGVSKVFSYTGNGSSQTINCGFTAGARFILIKRTDSTGDWYVWDTARGIVSGNDPHLSLNTTAAEVTTDDTIDTDSTGFIVNQLSATNVNVTSATYIGIAIA